MLMKLNWHSPMYYSRPMLPLLLTKEAAKMIPEYSGEETMVEQNKLYKAQCRPTPERLAA
jgi:hypothetical protein